MPKTPAYPEDPLITEKKNAVLEKVDAFADRHLNAEYKRLCHKLVERMAKEIPSPLMRGRPEIWASGVVYAIGSYNFLFDKSFKPYISAADLAAAFGVSASTASQKATAIRDRYGIVFPGTEYAAKRMRDMASNLTDNFAQMGMLFSMAEGLAQTGRLADATKSGPLMTDEFFVKPRSASKKGEFIDHEHDVAEDFYEIMEASDRLAEMTVRRKLEKLIQRDPDFYDSYSTLAELLDAEAEGAGDDLREAAYQRALRRITDKKGEWPRSLEWGWLENRHIIRALESKALMLWEKGQTEDALDLFRKLLRTNPRDNMGARHYILAIRRGEKNVQEHEEQFAADEGYLDARKLFAWFERHSSEYPEEFAEWREAVKQFD